MGRARWPPRPSPIAPTCPTGVSPRAASPGAVLDDPAEVARRAVGIAVDHQVTAVDGTTLNLVASSICVHGDTPGAAAMAPAGARRARGASG